MNILLDFDGVLNTTPSWRPVNQLEDGFMAFDADCAKHLNDIIQYIQAQPTEAKIVLTTTHRIHYDAVQWSALFANRGIHISANHISKVNHADKFAELGNRCEEIMAWIEKHDNEAFVVIDDDKSLHDLPIKYKQRWVETSFLIGLSNEKTQEVLRVIDSVI